MKYLGKLSFTFDGETLLSHEKHFNVSIFEDLKKLGNTSSLLRVVVSCHYSSLNDKVDINKIIKNRDVLKIVTMPNLKAYFIDWIVNELNFNNDDKKGNDEAIDVHLLLANAMLSGLTYSDFISLSFKDIIKLINSIYKIKNGIKKEVKKVNPDMMNNWFGV